MLKTYAAVMLGGCVGVAARMWLSTLMAASAFPVGTVVVNISGCFAIGLFESLTGEGGSFEVSDLLRKMIVIGVLGGFTTFSSFSFQTLNLLKQGQTLLAMLNVTVSVLGCLLATWAGMAAGGLINQR